MVPGTPRRVRGRVVALFAFDVAHGIELGAIPSVLRPERAQLVGGKRAPEYVRYDVPPVEVVLRERTLELAGRATPASVTARLFDFGAVSIAFALPLAGGLGELPACAESLATSDLAKHARAALEELVQDIRPALRRVGLNELVEDYFVFEIAEVDPPADAELLLREEAGALAAALSMDSAPLSRQQIEESLRDPVSYTPRDLVVADWSASIVVDPEPADTLAVLEFLNVQLVELRFLDARLDEALARFSSEVYRDETLVRAFRGPHREAIRALSELLVEGSSLSERVENALKLAPDVYLARVHRRSAARLGLPAWERTVQSKLDALRHLATVLSERAAARRAEALEVAIIALIALEIALALLGAVGG
jgi:hypothetical protein